MAMDWLILILGVPAILIPLVLLFGFAGCASDVVCSDDRDCPNGTVCAPNGSCVPAGEPGGTDFPPPPSAPGNLAATALDDHRVSLTWTNNDPAATVQIERAREDGVFDAIPSPADPSATGTTDAQGLLAGVTFIYRAQAVVEGASPSDFSDTSSATVFPAAPVNLRATALDVDKIELTWDNASAIETDYFVQHRALPAGVFADIPNSRGGATTFTHQGDPSLVEGTLHEYRVFAIIDGVENDLPQPGLTSAASASASTRTLQFTTAFTAPPNTLTTDQTGAEGFTVVQRLSTTLLVAGGNQVRILLRGSSTGSLTFDRITISQTADSQPGATGAEDLYDAAPDIKDVVPSAAFPSGVTIPPNTAVTVGPVSYTLDPLKDLLVAFDISTTPGEGNTSSGALTGADLFFQPPTPPATATLEARTQDRTSGYVHAANSLNFVEIIQVL
jgi:hypothetical protein